jgi:hypothetical protein
MKTDLIIKSLLAGVAIAVLSLFVWLFVSIHDSEIKQTEKDEQTRRASQECHNQDGVLITEANGELVCINVGHYYPDKL